MSDALTSVNAVMSQAGIEVLDLHGYVQLRCSCGKILSLDLTVAHTTCSCDAEYSLNVGLIAHNVG